MSWVRKNKIKQLGAAPGTPEVLGFIIYFSFSFSFSLSFLFTFTFSLTFSFPLSVSFSFYYLYSFSFVSIFVSITIYIYISISFHTKFILKKPPKFEILSKSPQIFKKEIHNKFEMKYLFKRNPLFFQKKSINVEIYKWNPFK